MSDLLKGKVAIVTGGASGIGKSVCELFVQNGAKVTIADMQEDTGKDLARELNRDREAAIFVRTDVADSESCRNMVETTVDHFGQLDIGVNNAGVSDGESPTGEKDLDQWHRVININLNGVFYCMRYQIPEILKQGGGAIVNMGSILSQVSFATASAYVAAKHGMLGLTRNAAVEYASKGIRINAVGPAFTNTPLLDALDDETKNMLVQAHPIGRLGEPNEVAELVMWLSSEKASFCHGGYYPVDGAYLCR